MYVICSIWVHVILRACMHKRHAYCCVYLKFAQMVRMHMHQCILATLTPSGRHAQALFLDLISLSSLFAEEKGHSRTYARARTTQLYGHLAHMAEEAWAVIATHMDLSQAKENLMWTAHAHCCVLPLLVIASITSTASAVGDMTPEECFTRHDTRGVLHST
jgi:hypothetical protein